MSALDTAKEIAGLVKKYNDIELYQKIVDLQGDLVALSTRNFELEKKCAELQSELNLKKSLTHSRNLYFAKGDTIPFCPHCYEAEGKLIHLNPKKMAEAQKQRWQCMACFHTYTAQDENALFQAVFDDLRAVSGRPRR